GMAMLRAHGGRHIFGVRARDLVRVLHRRQLITCKTEGVVWTPVLDEISAMRLWGADHVDQYEERWLERLVPWITRQSDSAALRDILRFRSPSIWVLVAKRASVLDARLIRRLLSQPSTAPELASNPCVTPAG